MGFDVTQATVSRDIQKLNLIKVKGNGKFKYAVVEVAANFSEKYIRIIKETIIFKIIKSRGRELCSKKCLPL